MPKRIFIVDANDGPCVRSLFTAVAAQGWEVVFFRPYAFHYYRRQRVARWGEAYRWRDMAPAIRQSFVPVPGFTRLAALSLGILRWQVASAMRRFGRPDVVVYTMPYYAALIEGATTPCVYFAYDPYRFYGGWDHARTAALETRILARADAVCVIARQMEEDWAGRVRGRLVHLPNATSAEFIAAGHATGSARPAELADLSGPVIGCVGNLNDGYDWALVAALARSLVHVNFVFLGTVTEVSPVLAEVRRLPNVHLPGQKPHAELPRYLSSFDVCFNPLALNDLNHRRCPLRLYDYLTTGKPVLSTAIREAEELREFIAIGRNAGECAGLLTRMLDGRYPVDLAARQRFIAAQTWEKRAEQFIGLLKEVSA